MTRRRLGFGIWVLGFLIWAPGLVPYASAQVPQAWPIERMPPPLPARAVTFPPYDIQTLRNGLQVITVLHHEQPAVTMRLLVRAGGANDPDKKRGVSMLVSTLLDQGTTTRSSQQIADQIDSIGGVLGTGSGDDFTSVSAIVMKDSFGVAMEMVADIIRNPAFAADEIDRQKEQITSTQQVNANDPDYLASAVFDRLVYGFHPYGLPGSGTPETMASISRQDLQAFHRQYFVPNNMVLAIVGDITQKEAAATAERVFGSFPRGDVPAWRGLTPPEPTRRVVIVDKPDAVQTEIRVGQLAIARKHPDFLKWDLAVKVLGGEGANRLHRVLRSERGLTYGASAETEGRKLAGDIVAETDTRTDTTGEALRLMIEEFLRLQRLRVPERELMDAQAYLAGSFPLTIESPNDIATQVINYVLYELPLEDIPTYTRRVSAITPDDIQRVAQSYLKPDRLSIVLVGNAKAFVPQLQALGLTNVEIIPVEQLDLMSATLRRETGRRVSFEPSGTFESLGAFEKPQPAYLAGQVNPRAGQPNVPSIPKASNVSIDRPAADLLRRVVDARGGLALLKGVKTVVADTVTTFQMQQGTLPSTTRTYIVYPDKFRVDAEISGAQTTQVFSAGRAWVKDPAGIKDAPAAMAADFAASVRRDIITLLVDAAEGRLTVRKLADQATQDGRPVQVLEVSGPQLDRVRLFIDQQMLIVGQAYSTPGPQARTILSEEVFSDYRFVSGIRVPFEAQLLQNGQPVLKRTITRVTFNEAVPESLFTKPS